MRKKKLKYVDFQNEDGAQFLLLEDRKRNEIYKIRDPQMSKEEEIKVQEDLMRIFEGGDIDETEG